MSVYKNAFKDLGNALSAHRLWIYMASSDIRLRYRGSTLGPLWITMTMVVFIATLSLVYSRLLNQQMDQYIPFLTCGLLIWNYISAVITESTETFTNSKEFIEGMKIPYFLFVMRMIWRNFLVFLHNSVVYILVIITFHLHLSWHMLLAIPGFLLVTALLTALSVIISLLGTRFRDLPPIITSMMTIVFFISPITWQSKLVGEDSMIILCNPVNYILDLIRPPLLGQLPHLNSLYITLGMAIVSWIIALWIYEVNSKKIPFWI